jgi:ribosomal protein L11 methyltransferase
LRNGISKALFYQKIIDLAGTSLNDPGYDQEVHVLLLECPATGKDLLLAELWERGTSGIVEQDLPAGMCALRSFFDEPFDASAWTAYNARWEQAEDRDWVAVAEAQWEPVTVGERFFLVPAWRDDATPPGRVRLEMQPGLACGTGWGAATQLALAGLERRLRPGAAVLDLGTGSGLLAVAAARLGAGRISACDIDEQAARVALERFRSEQIEVGLFTGSVRALAGASFDLLVANINAEVLTDLAPEILRVLRPAGAAVLTGFPERHLARVRGAFGGRGEVLERDEWRALVW